MFGPASSSRARLLRAGLATAAALTAVAPASAATTTKSWTGTCSVTPPGQTSISLPASFTFTATLPDTVRPGSSFGATNPSYTITLPGAAVKTLAAAGSGVTAKVSSLWLVSATTPQQITPDGYNLATGGVSSARQAFQTDQVNIFDGTKTTYKGLSMAVTPPSNTSALLASGSFKAEMNVATDVFGDLLIDQLFGQVKWGLYCKQGGTTGRIFVQSVRIANLTPVLSSLSPNTGPPAGGNLVTINGTNLEGATFRFGTATAGIVSASSTQVTVRAPAGTGVQEVRATASGLTSSPLSYTYAISSAPKITSVTPGTAWENLSARITVKTDQLLSASGVRFNGSAVNFTQSGQTITFDAPGLPKGTYPIAVTFQNGQQATASFSFVPWFT